MLTTMICKDLYGNGTENIRAERLSRKPAKLDRTKIAKAVADRARVNALLGGAA